MGLVLDQASQATCSGVLGPSHIRPRYELDMRGVGQSEHLSPFEAPGWVDFLRPVNPPGHLRRPAVDALRESPTAIPQTRPTKCP